MSNEPGLFAVIALVGFIIGAFTSRRIYRGSYSGEKAWRDIALRNSQRFDDALETIAKLKADKVQLSQIVVTQNKELAQFRKERDMKNLRG